MFLKYLCFQINYMYDFIFFRNLLLLWMNISFLIHNKIYRHLCNFINLKSIN
jgi:hypothetical protein